MGVESYDTNTAPEAFQTDFTETFSGLRATASIEESIKRRCD